MKILPFLLLIALSYDSFDSTYMYEYTLIMLFNLVFTSLPVAALGIVSRSHALISATPR